MTQRQLLLASLPIIALALLAASCVSGQASEPAAPVSLETPAGYFEPVWADEFDSPKVDTTKWYVLDRHEKYWPDMPWRRNYKAGNAFIENGALVLQTIKDGAGYSTACIQTADYGKPTLFEQTYGSFEARVKFPAQQGHWCAFWLMNNDEGSLKQRGEKNGGRDGTEIDIMEKAWLLPRIAHNLHWDGYAENHKSAGILVNDPRLGDGDWHVIRLEWYPTVYVFFVDGKETWRSAAGGVCQSPNHIILSEEIGNGGEGPEAWGVGPISQAALPDRFEVDYVRVGKFVSE
jgi:beta-glucanase (GH16 family)